MKEIAVQCEKDSARMMGTSEERFLTQESHVEQKYSDFNTPSTLRRWPGMAESTFALENITADPKD